MDILIVFGIIVYIILGLFGIGIMSQLLPLPHIGFIFIILPLWPLLFTVMVLLYFLEKISLGKLFKDVFGIKIYGE